MILADLARAVPGAAVEGDAAVEIVAVTHDSRDVVPGALFVALPGHKTDGRRFVPAARQAGAVAIALPFDAEGPDDLPVLRLPDPRADLARLASRVQGDPAARLTLVGLTGTNGKSTTASLFGEVTRAAGGVRGVIGTIRNLTGDTVRPARFTTPEAPELHTLLAEMVAGGVEIAVMEVTSVGLAEHRVDGLQFAAAAFLNLTVDHLDYHGDMATYGAAKRRLFTEHLRPGGVAVIDVDDAFGAALAAELPGVRPDVQVWTLSLRGPTAVHYSALRIDGHGVRGALQTPAGEVKLQSPLLGEFNARNLATVGALARAVGLPPEAIAAGLAEARVPGRLQPVANDRGLTVVVDYAHTPDALDRVIAALRPVVPGRLWCVAGCAGDRDTTKRVPMGRAAAAADAVIITSDNPRTEDPATIARAMAEGAFAAGRPEASHPSVGNTFIEVDRAAAIGAALAAAQPGDAVLIAGKGHETYQEVHGVRRPFDDVAVAHAVLTAEVGR